MKRWAGVAVFLLCLCENGVHAQAPVPYDLVIEHGHIIDGTGSPWYAADVGIRGGRIAAMGDLRRAPRTRTLDAAGQVVAPGFIDLLGQSESTMLVEPSVPSKIFQGITTEITGEGSSIAPLTDRMRAAHLQQFQAYGIDPDWSTLQEYFARLRKRGMGINLATFVGAATVREAVLGEADQAPSAAELASMQRLVADAMRQGALGVSTALMYAPGVYATTDELIALARTARQYGGIYATHIRTESNGEPAALAEAMRIGREADIPVHVWHLKVAGRQNWGHAPQILEQMEAARTGGLDLSADTYCYPAWANDLSAFLPPWAHDGGNARLLERLRDPSARTRLHADLLTPSSTWDNEWQEIPGPEAILITVVRNPELKGLQGMRLGAIAAQWNEGPIDALFDLLLRDGAQTQAAVFGMDERDNERILTEPWVSIGTDWGGTSPSDPILGKEFPHPRAYGTFTRVLNRYVREQHLLSLPEAIRKFTAQPAAQMRLEDRGLLRPGMWADIVVFDPEKVRDVATFEDPNRLSIGMRDVLVNGVPVIEDGRMTHALPGQVLLGPAARGTAAQAGGL